MPAVPTTTAMVKIQRNNRSRTIATYFQSSFACGKNMWRIVSLWFLCQNCEVGGEVYSDWPNLQQAPTVGAKDAQYYCQPNFCADPNFKKDPNFINSTNFTNTQFQKYKISETIRTGSQLFSRPGAPQRIVVSVKPDKYCWIVDIFHPAATKIEEKIILSTFLHPFPCSFELGQSKNKSSTRPASNFYFFKFFFCCLFFIYFF